MRIFYVFLKLHNGLDVAWYIEANSKTNAWGEVKKELYFHPYLSINKVKLIDIYEQEW